VTGQRLWELNVAGIATPSVAGDWLFLVADDAKLIAVARNSGKVRWITQLPRWQKEKSKKGPTGGVGRVWQGTGLSSGGARGGSGMSRWQTALWARARTSAPMYSCNPSWRR